MYFFSTEKQNGMPTAIDPNNQLHHFEDNLYLCLVKKGFETRFDKKLTVTKFSERFGVYHPVQRQRFFKKVYLFNSGCMILSHENTL